MTPIPVDIRIGQLTVSAASGIAARRLAEGLPQALARAVARYQAGEAAPQRPTPADRAAGAILADLLHQRPDLLDSGGER